MEEKDLLQNSCGGFPYPVTTQGELESFSCGDKDLDDFFHQDCFDSEYFKKSNTEEDSEFKENKELSSSIDWKTRCGKGVPRNSFICWFTSD